MSFAREYLDQLGAIAAQARLPRVRALHLPPPPRAEDLAANLGEFCAIELEDGTLGLSYVLLDDTLERLRSGPGGRVRAGADPLQLAAGFAAAQGVERTLGFAAANAITRWVYDRAGYLPPGSGDSIGGIDPQAGDHVGMIGLFTPLVGRVLGSGARLTVVERKAELAGAADGYVVTLDPAALLACNKVIATGTLLLNDTLDQMLACCRNARSIAMIGPTASCLPDRLFARGVTMLGGTWVTEAAGFLAALRSGGARGTCARKFTIRAEQYPGTAALLARI